MRNGHFRLFKPSPKNKIIMQANLVMIDLLIFAKEI